MIEVTMVDHIRLVSFWLCFIRWHAILIHIPLFDSSEVPQMVKILTSLMIAFAFFNETEAIITRDIYYCGAEHFWILTFCYLFISLALGQFIKMILQIGVAAGNIITQTIGFSAIKYFDPTSAQSIGPIEKLIQLTLLMMILASGALLPMIKGIYISFRYFNLFTLSQIHLSPDMVVLMMKSFFHSTLLLSAPFILSNLLINVVMGVMGRVVPQINILMVSFAINIGVGLVVFMTTSDEFFHVVFKIYTEALGNWFQYIT